MFDPKSSAFLVNALSHLKSLLSLAPSALGSSDSAVSFWCQEGQTPSRIAFLGPTGARIPEIVNSLTGMSLREADLREVICEAVEPPVVRWLFEDGTIAEDRKSYAGAVIQQRHGAGWMGLTVSGGLLNVPLQEGAIEPTAWVDRISIPIIVTSARAVLGVAESNLIRRLQKEHRFFTLLVTGIEGDPDQVVEIRNEIDAFKIKPFMEEAGYFSVIYCQQDLSWINDLSAIITKEIGKSHCLQLVFVVQRWIENWSAILENLWVEDQKKCTQVNEVRVNLANMTARLMDIAQRTATNIRLNIIDLYSSLENTADKTAAHFVANMTPEPLESLEDLVIPMKKAWIAIDEVITKAPQDLWKSLDAEWTKEIASFSESYRSILVRQPIELPALRAKSFQVALEVWQQLSLEKFSAHIIKSLEKMQAKYQDKSTNAVEEMIKGESIEKWRIVLTEILKKGRSMSMSANKLEYEVSSMITEGLRRYVRDRMNRITQAMEEDTNFWFVQDLRCSLDAWRLAINKQLDAQLAYLKSDDYKGMLLPHRDVWRQLSLKAHTEL